MSINELNKIDKHGIQRLPILTKENLRKFGKTDLLSNDLNFFVKSFYLSSGSTGTPVNILLAKSVHQTWNALYEARVRKWAGVNRNFIRAIIGGRRVLPQAIATKPFYRINIFENQYYFSAYHINKKNAIHYLEAINNKSIYYLVGYAMSIYFLALFIKKIN